MLHFSAALRIGSQEDGGGTSVAVERGSFSSSPTVARAAALSFTPFICPSSLEGLLPGEPPGATPWLLRATGTAIGALDGATERGAPAGRAAELSTVFEGARAISAASAEGGASAAGEAPAGTANAAVGSGWPALASKVARSLRVALSACPWPRGGSLREGGGTGCEERREEVVEEIDGGGGGLASHSSDSLGVTVSATPCWSVGRSPGEREEVVWEEMEVNEEDHEEGGGGVPVEGSQK